MALKRSEMDAQILLNLGNRSNITLANRTVWLNWALTDVASLRDWRAMKKTDTDSMRTRAGGVEYEMPPNLKNIFDVSYQNGVQSRPLQYKPPYIFRKQIPKPEEYGSGYPIVYTWEGTIMRLYPPPDTNGLPLHIYGSYWPDEFLVASDEECPLPRLEHAIISLATSYGFEAIRDFRAARQWYQEGLKRMQRQARLDGDPEDWTPRWASERLRTRVGDDVFVVELLAAGERLNDPNA